LAKVEPCLSEAPTAREQDMKQTRKKHGAAFKAKVALSAIKGDWMVVRASEDHCRRDGSMFRPDGLLSPYFQYVMIRRRSQRAAE
jgi:hypothetical protein